MFKVLLAMLSPHLLCAQTSAPEAERRFAFVQTYFGVDWLRAGSTGACLALP